MAGNKDENQVKINERIMGTDKYRKLFLESSTNEAFRPNKEVEYNVNSDASYRFKHGIEFSTNQDEEPVIYGFDIFIDTIKSPLFAEMPDFFAFGNAQGIRPIIEREHLYLEFVEELKKYFRTIGASSVQNFKSHYIQEVKGLDKLVWTQENMFTEYMKDKITLSMREDTYLNTGYLAQLYKNLVYDKVNGRIIIPDNLLKFDMTVSISEVRNFQKFAKMSDSPTPDDGRKAIQSFKDNISRYLYNLYDCSFGFDSMSHEESVSNNNVEFFQIYPIDIYYKFSDVQMEKFKFVGNYEPDKKYTINNQRMQKGKDRILVSDLLIANDKNTTGESNGKGARQEEFNTDDSMTLYFTQKDLMPNHIYNHGSTTATVSAVKQDKAASDPLSDVKKKAVEEEKNTALSDLQKIAAKTKEYVKQKVIKKRDALINNTIRAIRRATGLRRISSPINVYEDDNVYNFAKNQVRDFVNNRFTEALRGKNNP